MKKVACFLFFIGVVLPYGYACLINSALSKIYLIGAAIAAVALGLVTFLAYRKDKTARWEKAIEKAKTDRIAREKAEEEARQKAEAERIAREKAEEEARQRAEAERIAREKAAQEKAEAEQIARERADHEAKVAQFNASIRQQLADLEAVFQKAQEEEVAVIAALKAL